MSNQTNLRPIIGLDEEKCTGCLRCIMKCPVKMCNNASKAGLVTFNGELCIGCGECIPVCEPKARYGIDDFKAFITDLKAGTSMIAVVTPAIAASFDGMYLKFNGFLKKLGIKAAFDVSFGAELTVKSYLEYRKKKKPTVIIAQPCPTLVSFIEMYHPDLIPYLAPVDSPILHSIKMIRRFFPQYAKCKVAVISPCLSKRREFDVTGHGDYNVTFKSIQDYLDLTGDRISNYQNVEYEGPAAERAVLFSSPGGLMRTVERYDGNVGDYTKKVEGFPEVYHYLEYLEDILRKGKKPLYPLVDCLSCELGCNGGPGTLNHRAHSDDLLEKTEARNKAAREYHGTSAQKFARRKTDKLKVKMFKRSEIEKSVKAYWVDGLYSRSYTNRSGVVDRLVKIPTAEKIRELHLQMYKKTKEDFLNCHACGYETCDQMAIACINGLSRFENCRHYTEVQKRIMEKKHKEDLAALLTRVHKITQDEVNKNVDGISSLSGHIDNSTVSILNSFTATEEIVKGVHSIHKMLEQSTKALENLSASSAEGKRRLMQINGLISDISAQSDALIDVAKIISNVADETNILGMNAAIQAAHAGESVGRGFAVVAGQIRQLASSSASQAGEIAKRLRDIKTLIDNSHVSSNEAVAQFDHIVNLVGEVHESDMGVRGTVEVQTTSGQYAMGELNKLKESAMMIQEESDALLVSSKTVLDNIDAIKNIGT